MIFKFLLIFLTIFLSNLHAHQPSLREQISQMIMVGFNGSTTNDVGVRAMLSDLSYARFGGVILLGRNVKDKSQLKNLISNIKSKKNNTFIAIDEEGGSVTRLRHPSFEASYLSAYDIGIGFDINDAQKIYKKMSLNLKELGINVNFAPVVDLHNPKSPIIGAKKRAYSSNPQKVTLYAEVFMNELHKNGIFSVLKHFPGHGDAMQDSHNENTYTTLTRDSLLPYKNLAKKAKMIMVGHIFVQNLDDKNPATFSNIVINRLLREELGFKGVVISDDMLMAGAKHGDLRTRIIKFINSGGDILLFSEFKFEGKRIADIIYEEIVQAINENKITKERIYLSYQRVMKLKKELN